MNGKQLKNSILQWAIQGKLVPQDPNDEPASLLLERIRAEKERLIKEKKIKRSKNESIIYRGEDNSYYEKFEDGSVKCIDDEIPFEIPNGWEWCRLSTVCSYLHRGKSPKYGMVKELPIIAQKCNQWDKLYIDRCQYSDIDFIAKYSDDQYVQLHDILINSTGGGTVGRTGFVDDSIFELYSRFVADSHVTVVRPFASVSPRYVYFYLISPYIQVGLEDRCSGSTNQIELGTSTIGNYLLPLPPYKEQERIISIVNDILPKVIIYGNSQDKLNSLNQQIRLSLKKSILQEAIQGRLVSQDSNDEPASVLLERIRAEKERLIKEKKIKHNKNESIIYKGDDNSYYEKLSDGTVSCINKEIPFRLPKSWSWCRMEAVCQYLHRGKSPNYGLIKELPIIAQKCNHWDKLYIDRCQFSDIDSIEKYSAAQFLQPYDILINSPGGGTVGRTGIIGESIFNLYPRFVTDSHVTVVRTSILIIQKYIYYFLISPYIQVGLEDRCSGSTNQIELGTNTIGNYLLPLPPYKEQKRIVEKIDKLFKFIK